MKKIAIDITHYNLLSGYGIVTRNVIKGLLEKDTENFYYLFSHEHKDLEGIKHYTNFQFINTYQNFIRYKFFFLPYYLKKYDIDIFISLDQDLPLRKVCQYICISHDIGSQIKGRRNMLKQIFMPGVGKCDRIYHLLDLEGLSLHQADYIFVPSENTKHDIISHYKIPEEKILLNYRGLDHLHSLPPQPKKDYILFPYSNLYSDFQYILANEIVRLGLAKWVIFLRPAYRKTPIKLHDNVQIIDTRISDTDNQKYYQEAKLSIYLSDYDGFGFVPLESVFYNTPVVYNIHSCMSEIIGDGGIGIKELDVKLFSNVIQSLLTNKDQYNQLLITGKKNNARFNWRQTINIFLLLINR